MQYDDHLVTPTRGSRHCYAVTPVQLASLAGEDSFRGGRPANYQSYMQVPSALSELPTLPQTRSGGVCPSSPSS